MTSCYCVNPVRALGWSVCPGCGKTLGSRPEGSRGAELGAEHSWGGAELIIPFRISPGGSQGFRVAAEGRR